MQFACVPSKQQPRSFLRLVLALGLLFTLFGCSPQLSDAERTFYAKSASVNVGDRSEKVSETLGQPTRVGAAGEQCKATGATQEWIYERAESSEGASLLRAGAIVICIAADGRVTGKVDLYS